MRHRPAVGIRLHVQQLHDIADGDAGGRGAPGGKADRAAMQRVPSGRRHLRIAVAHLPQPRKPLNVTGLGHATRQGTSAGHRRYLPRQAGAHDLGADRHRQRRAEHRVLPVGVVAAAAQPLRGELPPARASSIRPAGQPTVLPAGTRLPAQPPRQQHQPTAALLLAAGALQRKRRSGQPLEHLRTALPRGRPRRCRQAGRKPGRCGPRRRRRCWRPDTQRFPRNAGGHDVSSPDKTSRVSGR